MFKIILFGFNIKFLCNNILGRLGLVLDILRIQKWMWDGIHPLHPYLFNKGIGDNYSATHEPLHQRVRFKKIKRGEVFCEELLWRAVVVLQVCPWWWVGVGCFLAPSSNKTSSRRTWKCVSYSKSHGEWMSEWPDLISVLGKRAREAYQELRVCGGGRAGRGGLWRGLLCWD